LADTSHQVWSTGTFSQKRFGFGKIKNPLRKKVPIPHRTGLMFRSPRHAPNLKRRLDSLKQVLVVRACFLGRKPPYQQTRFPLRVITTAISPRRPVIAFNPG
jgi:hypothetical protein